MFNDVFVFAVLFLFVVAFAQAPGSNAPSQKPLGKDVKIIFLHHSTGSNVWQGGVAAWFKEYNASHAVNYQITEQAFPKEEPYGWKNYPFDYWNIWVNHAGPNAFQEEPTLEILTRKYNVIVFKHCFPVASVNPDTGKGDVSSEDKRAENYKLQYEALKSKLRQFPNNRFVVWTGAMLCQTDTDEASAKRAKDFFRWVKTSWDEKGDNIYVWDFETLETDGGLYLKKGYEAEPGDSHPGKDLCKRIAPLFAKRVVDCIEGRGDSGSLTGQ